MRYFKIIALMILGVLGVMQFFRPAKNINTSPEAVANDITKVVAVPGDVQAILVKACNDCHSNNTHYPWYANVMPVGWILSNHIKEGKREINFNEFAVYPIKKQLHKLEEVAEQVERDEMPMSSYRRLHKEARLTDAEKKALMDWAKQARSELMAKNPPAATKQP
jgi:hypothetical protein